MKKSIIVILFIILITLIISNVWIIQIESSVLSAFFTVAGIVFSIGLSLIVSFNMTGIENPSFIKNIRSDLYVLKNKYLIYFGFSSAIYLLNEILFPKQSLSLNIVTIYELSEYEIVFNIGLLACVSFIFSIIYSVNNMLRTQKLNHDIFDEVLNNKKEE